MKFLVFSDSLDVSKQILSFLSGKGETRLLSPREDNSLRGYGASEIVLLKGSLTIDSVSEFILKEFAGSFDYLIIASTSLGRDIAGYISEKMNVTVAHEVFSIAFKDGKIVTKRFDLGGKVVIEEESSAKIVTVLPGISEGTPSGSNSPVRVVEIPAGKVRVVSVEPKKGKEVDLEKASIIVSVGRGLGKKEGLQQIEPFAKKIGAEIAGSRPVCLDYHWLSEDRQVGYSGRKVRPKIYLALGISGQIQHIAGMRDSKIVIAVNKDKNAPIFQECDYGIVGDLYTAVQKISSYL